MPDAFSIYNPCKNMTSRKKFIESAGATCANWNWSWSFVNHDEKFVIFGLEDKEKDGLILDESWKGPGRKQSLEHVRLVSEEGYGLKIYPMKLGEDGDNNLRIKEFEPVLIDKLLVVDSGRWRAVSESAAGEFAIPEEVADPKKYPEGATSIIYVNAYERNREAREACIKHYGCKCFVCNFNFEDVYGSLGGGYIHVHHENPLFQIKEEYMVDPIKDLKPLCHNCHAMVHKTNPPMRVEDLIECLARR